MMSTDDDTRRRTDDGRTTDRTGRTARERGGSTAATRAMGRWTRTGRDAASSSRETTNGKIPSEKKSDGWFSRAFAKATGRASERERKERTAAERTVVEDGTAVARVGRRMEETRLDDGGGGGGGGGETKDDDANGGGVGKAAVAAKKMRVEDFEPLKLIGRGAFGAWWSEASEG